MYAEVCFPFSLSQTFSYYVPQELQSQIKAGYFVVVNFRAKPIKGLVTNLSFNTQFKGKLNNIISIDLDNVIPNELWKTLQWMENYYITPMGKIAQVTLSWIFKKNISSPKKIKHIKLKNKNFDDQKLTNNQKIFINYLLQNKTNFIPLKSLQSKIKSSYSIYKQLKNKGMIIEELQSLQTNCDDFIKKPINNIVLTKIQKEVYQNIYHNFKNNNKPHFLHGITGSGKTEIYLRLAYDFISKGKSCLILVPEITLSSQIYNRFKKYFGADVILWHSKISHKYKRDAWDRMNNKDPLIVIGARSALFAPLYHLGLIVVDEEHDNSYKESEKQPSYSARDIAIIRGKFSEAMVLLGSATPSLESYYNTIINKYYLYQINERYGDALLPEVEVVNMSTIKDSFILKPILSELAINTIQEKLDKKEQILILHNRRGFSSLRISNQPDGLLKCKRCDIILTLHQSTNQLICHHCHSKESISSINKKYNNPKISYAGYGTEQLELLLKQLFLGARVLRMDADSANSMRKQIDILNKFKNKKGDILLGTQMIAKGLDFDNITLVVVVNADLGTLIPDFKSHEKMFQLIYQVIGRAGRSNKQSKAIIQTYQPNNKVIQMATQYELKNFYNLQLNNRKDLSYPPFTRLIRIIFNSANLDDCKKSASKIFNSFSKSSIPFLLGPLPCPIEKLSNKFRYHIIIKAPHLKFKNILKEINHIQNQKESLISKRVKMLIDVDANSVL